MMHNFSPVWDAQLDAQRAGQGLMAEVKAYPRYTRANNKTLRKQQESGVRVPKEEHLSGDGMTFYNDLTLKVQRDRKRKERKTWETAILQRMWEEKTSKGKKQRRVPTAPLVPPRVCAVIAIPRWKTNEAESDDSSSDEDN
jgi:hypothetical protein